MAERQLALLIDLERCTGCRACEAACKLENRLGQGVFRNKVWWIPPADSGGRFEFMNTVCQQCERPACMRVCGAEAISKDPVDGVVRVDYGKCTGCQECVVACPYGAISFDPRTHQAEKCDLGANRRAQGLPPACVAACPGRAIEFGARDELIDGAVKAGRQVRDIDRFGLRPSTVYLEPLTATGCTAERAVYAPTTWLGLPTRMWKEARRVTTGLFSGGSGPEAFPYTDVGKPPEFDRKEVGSCPICFNSCPAEYHIKEGRVTTITGFADDPVTRGRLCPKGQSQIQMFYSRDRLTTPLRRVGKRGRGRFEAIDWEVALDEVAARLAPIRDTYGPEALAIFTGTRSSWMNKRGAAQLFAQLWGTPNHQGTDPLCASAASVAFSITQGFSPGGNSFTEGDLGAADYYLFVGDNMAETRPVYFGLIHDCRIRRGAPMVCVDPRMSATAAKADRWICIRPGTDMALALAMMHHIVSRGLQAREFLDRWVAGADRLEEFIVAKQYTPEWASRVTDISAETIRQLAEELAGAKRAVVFGGKGLNQHINGLQSNRAFQMLCILLGHWGRPGAGFMNLNRGLALDANAPKERNQTKKPGLRKSPTGWIDAMLSDRPYPIKALICTGNPLATWPGQARLREALGRLELVVYMELFPHETAYFADYVFPMASGIEAGDVNRSNDDRRVGWIEKLIDPPGEARPDIQFWIELGKRFGFDDVLREEYKDPARLWDREMLKANGMGGLTVARMKQSPSRWVRAPLVRAEDPEIETLFEEGSTHPGDAEGRRFPTPSGKLEIWTEELEKKFAIYGLSPLPDFYTDREQLIELPTLEYLCGDDAEGVPAPFWNGKANTRPVRIVDRPAARPAADYDLELISGRPPAPHFHSWTQWFWQAKEMWPEQFAQLHPETARALGIKDRDRVVIENDRGWIGAVAWVQPGIRKSAVFVPLGWDQRQPVTPARSVNWLIDHRERCPISDQTNMKSILCRVRKA